MAITKTDFINYSRCRRYVSLEEIKKEHLEADIDYDSYKEQEKADKIEEIYGSLIELDENGEEIDLTKTVNAQLEAMMPYYKQVEEEAGRLSKKIFGGTSTYALETKNQECFDTLINGIRYKCYVDIFNESDTTNIIEVKATTSNKYLKMGAKKNNVFNSIFIKKGDVYCLKEEIPGYPILDEMKQEQYDLQRSKLFDYYKTGKYVFDLAIQRYIIEHEYRESKNEEKLKNFRYYLAVLNHEYTYDGSTDELGKIVYNPDILGNEIVVFFDMTKITSEYQEIIDNLRLKIEKSLTALDASPCKLGEYCQYKCQSKCKYFDLVCGKIIPKKHSSLSYLQNGFGFKDEYGNTIKGLDLINEGYINMLDVPESWIKRKTHQIQRDCLSNQEIYLNKEKLKSGLNQLRYPIYHLDFETFPCPMPRYVGEKPYIQSPFEFSLHIERKPGECDLILDNHVFLAKDHSDCRLDLIEKLLLWTEDQSGMMFAQNVSFEKGRIKELAHIFPQYKDRLMKLYDNSFDLLWLVNTNSEIYKSIGYEDEEAKVFNYYHNDLNGSFSIKKTLPVFSDLSYHDLVVKNGTEAIVSYARYNLMSKEERDLIYYALITYCRQDTYAMVVILHKLQELVK